MGKKSKDSDKESSAFVHSLFSADNPFRRKPQEDAPVSPAEMGLGFAEEPSEHAGVEAAEVRKRKYDKRNRMLSPGTMPDSIPMERKKLGDGPEGERSAKKRNKRKRDDLEEGYEKRMYGSPANASDGEGNTRGTVAVGKKRKAADLISSDTTVSKESFDDESKLMRTIFVGNLPLKTNRKNLTKEFGKFGEIESVRFRSVPILDSKTPRKGAIIQGKINDAVDSIHAYIVFKDVQYAKAALSQNMTQFGGNHIRIDIACPPRKKLKGEGPLYDRKRTLFVGNLPFDVRDEELYQLFCGASELESNVEAIRVIRDSQTSLGRGIAYVLLKNREAANSMVRKRDWEIRDRILRVCHARSTDGAPSITPTKRKNENRREFPQKKPVVTSEKAKAKGPTPSYQGLRSNKSGALKKSNLQRKPTAQVNHKGKRRGLGESGSDFKATKAKRPAVAARKAKQLLMKRKQEGGTPGDRMHKKARKS